VLNLRKIFQQNLFIFNKYFQLSTKTVENK
jgi:hypothetical protein